MAFRLTLENQIFVQKDFR